MKEIRFKKASGQGNVDGICRISGKMIYFKYNDSNQARMVIEEFRKKGIKIKESRLWLQVDLLGENDSIKLGDSYIDIQEDSDEEIENKLFKFYKFQYEKLGFYIETDEGDENAIAT